MQWSWAFNLVCEVALKHIYLLYNTKPSPFALSKFGLHHFSTLDKLFVIGPRDKKRHLFCIGLDPFPYFAPTCHPPIKLSHIHGYIGGLCGCLISSPTLASP